jgi:hypothetical protein
MLCSNCGQFNTSGTFCTSCGTELQGAQTSSPGGLKSLLADKKKVGIVGGVALLLVVGLVAFFLLKSSPAVPYLKSACAILTPVDFDKKGVDDMESIVRSAGAEIDSALAADGEVAAPFSSIIPSIEYSIEQQTEAATYLARAISSTFFTSIYLSRSSDALDKVKSNNIRLEADIQRVCKEYK